MKTLIQFMLLGVLLSACTAHSEKSENSSGLPQANTQEEEKNKQIGIRIYNEVFNAGNMSVADQLIAADVKEHDLPDSMQGIQNFKNWVSMMRKGFPDLKMTPDKLMADGDMGAAHVVMTGTHSGEFMGVPASGKKVRVGGIDMARFKDGKVIEHWGVFDIHSLMMQIHGDRMMMQHKDKMHHQDKKPVKTK